MLAVRQAPIVILDEPTASLDKENQYVVHAALNKLTASRTSLMITHDLHLAASADQILFLEGGRLCERGTHAQLMALDGRYAALYRLQTGKSNEKVPMLEDRFDVVPA